jgi:hypothetical protein
MLEELLGQGLSLEESPLSSRDCGIATLLRSDSRLFRPPLLLLLTVDDDGRHLALSS